MSLYDRDSGDEEAHPRRIIPGCTDGLCGATDCPRCGHETAVDEGETWAGRCARIERLRLRKLAQATWASLQAPFTEVRDLEGHLVRRVYRDFQ